MVNDPGTAGACVAAAGAGPVVPVRYRCGIVGESARTVHVVSLPTGGPAGSLNAVCGAVLMLDGLEAVMPGQGMPCNACLARHARASTAIEELPAQSAGCVQAVGHDAYHQWGWPVAEHDGQVRLSLNLDVSTMAIPTPLGVEVTRILTQRRCAPAVLAHPRSTASCSPERTTA